jgi:hypothetical protein
MVGHEDIDLEAIDGVPLLREVCTTGCGHFFSAQRLGVGGA